MANTAEFGHDNLGHLLADKLLTVPRFQRRYSWGDTQVLDYWNDINTARNRDESYFMGTIVLAHDTGDNGNYLIVDGQQRVITTALLFAAIRDRLAEFDQPKAADKIKTSHLSDYILETEEENQRLQLSDSDNAVYANIIKIDCTNVLDPKSNLVNAYNLLKTKLRDIAKDVDDYKELIRLSTYLDTQVQVLTATASGLPEAYVIFETLNDRGADLTTADLLKNYMFSVAGKDLDTVSNLWLNINDDFEKPEDLVSFLRQDFVSRSGRVTNRELYKALRGSINGNGNKALTYLRNLKKTNNFRHSIESADDKYWSSEPTDVRDSLVTLRRFRLEALRPILFAAFQKWKKHDVAVLINRISSWFIRAWVVDSLNGSVSEKAICDAASAISNGSAQNADDVLEKLTTIIPDDETFRSAFVRIPKISTTRAKCLLAQIEKTMRDDKDTMPDWTSRYVTVEHIFAKSSTQNDFQSKEDFDEFTGFRDSIANYTLLETTLNSDAKDNGVQEKLETYRKSAFIMTQRIGNKQSWTIADARSRLDELGQLSIEAWPL